MAIRFLQPLDVLKIVSVTDDAIDREKSNLNLYQENYELKDLVFKEGEKPTFFLISNLKSTDLVTIQSDHYIAEMPKITPGMTKEQMAGMKVKVTPVRQGEMLVKYFKSGVQKLIDNDKEIELTDDLVDTIPPNIIQEIGALVMSRSILTDTKKKS